MSRPSSSARLSANDELELDRMSVRNRPSSASSRRAWDLNEGGIDNPAGPQSRQSYSDSMDQPAAMENEMYVDGTVHVVDGRTAEDEHIIVEEPQGCWWKFKKGLRCEYLISRNTHELREPS